MATETDSSVNPEPIAHAVVWLASDESNAVDGLTLSVKQELTLFPGLMEFRFQRDSLADQSHQGKL